MTTYYSGRLLDVTEITLGSELARDHITGENVIEVYDVDDYDSEGGQVEIEGEQYLYLPWDDDELEEETLTLTTNLVDDFEEGTQVYAFPLTTAREAMVMVTGDEGDPPMVRVPQTMYDALETIIREDSDQESLILTKEDDQDWVLHAILDEELLRDGSYINPDTVPLPEVVYPTEPPLSSPALSVVGLAESFILKTESVPSTTYLTYEVSTDYDEITEIGTWGAFSDMPVHSTIIPVRQLPSGEPFQATVPDENDEPVPVPYWFRVLAANDVGPATGGPSAVVRAQLDLSAVSLIAQSLITEQVIAGFALLGKIEVGGDTFTLSPPDPVFNPEDRRTWGGIYIELSNGGLIHIPANGAGVVLRGVESIEVENLEVDGLDVRGESYVGGEVTIRATIADPTVAPEAIATYESLQVPESASYGLCRSVENDGWVTMLPSGHPVKFDDTGAEVLRRQFPIHTQAQKYGGITRIGSSYYVLYWHPTYQQQFGIPPQFLTVPAAWKFAKLDAVFGYEPWESATDLPSNTDRLPSIGTDGTDVLVAFRENGGTHRLHRYSSSTGARTLSVVLSGADNYDYAGIYGGNADYSAFRWVAHPRTSDVRAYTDESPAVEQSGDSWPRPMGHQVRGMWWDGTHFWCLNGIGTIRKLENRTAAPTETRHWSYAYPDSDTHITGPSPTVSFTRPKRSKVQVTAPGAPQEFATDTHVANRIQIYASATSGGTKYQQGSALPVGQRTAVITTVNLSGTTSQANNWAGVVNPGEIRSEILDAGDLPLINLKGNGNIGRDSGDVAASGSYSGSARAIRFGKMVVMNVEITRASGFNSTAESTGIVLPLGMRPLALLHSPAVPFYNSANTYRFRVQTSGVVEIQMSAASGQIMAMTMCWFIAAP